MAVKKKKLDTQVKPAQESAGFSCYIGPTIVGVIQTGTIYPAGKADAPRLPELAYALERVPEIEALVVDGATLAQDRVKVKKAGESLKAFYNRLARRK